MDSFDVLLSHNSKNKAGVRELFSALVERGLRPWLDEEHLIPGRRWQDALEEIIAVIPAAAVLVGRDGIGPWEDVEMRAVLLEFPRRKLPVIPVLLPGAAQLPELPLFLRVFTWVDLREGLTEEGIDRLVWGITGKRPQRPASPRHSPFARAIVGIDLGTTQSAVAVMTEAGVKVIASDGYRATPSVVAFVQGGESLVGMAARRQAFTNPRKTIGSIKRFMGRKYSEVGEELRRVPYPLEKAENGDVCVAIEGRRYAPPEISAMILGKLKQAAEDYLGEKVERAVITVPSGFSEAQREATRSAARIAGLEVVRLVNEAAAAALAYGFYNMKDHTIAVYDFGGGSFDISILEVGEGVVEVKATIGDVQLGGDNMDQRVIEWLLEELKKDQGIDPGNDPMAMQRLKEAAEKAKIELSNARETEINLPYITADASGPKHFNLRLTRQKLEQLVDDLIQKSVGLCRQALKDAEVNAEDIDEVVLVGGQTRMPSIQKLIKDFFCRAPSEVDFDQAVAMGAAIQGGVLRGDVRDILLLDTIPWTLGIETLGGIFTKLIERNTKIPTRKSEIFTTSHDNQISLEVHVLHGEREMARDNCTLGQFHLADIPAAPRGVPQIEVAFDIDSNGTIRVSAKDLGTGNEQQINVRSMFGLSERRPGGAPATPGAQRPNLPAVAL